MKQDDSHPSQNVLPSETPPSAGVLGVRPTQAHVGGPVEGNTQPSNRGPGRLPLNNSSPVNPVSFSQGGVNENSATPSSGTNGTKSPAPVTSPSQVGGNKGKEVPGANSPAPVTRPSQAGGTPSSGTNGTNSLAPLTGPSQVGGNQGKDIAAVVSLPAGSASNPNKAGTSGNSGAAAESNGNAVGVSTNPAQPNGA